MTGTCACCGTTIEADDVRYNERSPDGLDTYCSVNCIADVDHVDEDRARNRIFADGIEA